MLRNPFARRRPLRRGGIVVMVAILLPVLLGMVGLVIDFGRILGAHRQAQNAADGAALAGAQALVWNNTGGTPSSYPTGTTLSNYPNPPSPVAAAQAYLLANGLPANGANQYNNPPQAGNYAGKNQYMEVIVTYPVQTMILQVLGVASQTVTARGVAGYETYQAPLAVILLNANGLTGSGNVNFNATAGGVWAQTATSTSSTPLNSLFWDISGNVTNPADFQGGPLRYNTAVPPVDPLASLPTPSMANGVVPIIWAQDSQVPAVYPSNIYAGGYWNPATGTWWIRSFNGATNTGVINRNYSYGDSGSTTPPAPSSYSSAISVSVSSGAMSIPPGVYGSIIIFGTGATINFAWDSTMSVQSATNTKGVLPQIYAGPSNGGTYTGPSTNIYVMAGASATDLSVAGNQTIIGNNMMIYNTSTSYNAANAANPNGSSAQFGIVNFAGQQNITFYPIGWSNGAAVGTGGSPFQDMLFYQSRANTKTMTFAGTATNNTINGILYSPNGAVNLSNFGDLNTQIIAGSMNVSGSGTLNVNLNYGNLNLKLTTSVFLVE